MKALLFVIFISLISFSSQGSFLDTHQTQTKQHEEDFLLYVELEEGMDLLLPDRAVMLGAFLEYHQEQEKKGNRICLSTQPSADDADGANEFWSWVKEVTHSNLEWVNNIGKCDTIWHISHGRMIGNETFPRMYDLSIEKIAHSFKETIHINMTCRGSYEWVGAKPGALTEEEDLVFDEYMDEQRKEKGDSLSLNRLSYTSSDQGIGNLMFSNPAGYWTWAEDEIYFGKYIQE